jgi:hypothetical protein
VKANPKGTAVCCVVFLICLTTLSGCQSSKDAEIARLKEENGQLRAKLGIQTPTSTQGSAPSQVAVEGNLDITRLKTYQNYTYAKIDIRVTNKSDLFLDYWEVHADVFDSGKKYLANAYTNGQNLRPGQSVTATLLINNVNSHEIASWQPSIGRATASQPGGARFDATRFLTTKEVEP